MTMPVTPARRQSRTIGRAHYYSMLLRIKQATGNGVYGGKDGGVGAAWLFEPHGDPAQGQRALLRLEVSAYAHSTPIAGVLDPITKAVDPNGEYFYFAREAIWGTKAGATSRYITNGGGGWGDPHKRPIERVLSDVRDAYVSLAAARDVYGVVIDGDPYFDPEGLTVDELATQKLRA